MHDDFEDMEDDIKIDDDEIDDFDDLEDEDFDDSDCGEEINPDGEELCP